MGFEQFLQLIRDGEPVSAGVANRSSEILDRNLRWLYERLLETEAGSTVYAYRQTIETTAVQGAPVYFNTTRQQFERGLAQQAAVPTEGALLLGDSAKLWGVVARKLDTDLADILLFGYTELDISAAVVGGVVEAGTYYLSGTYAGMLTLQRPGVSVPVLRADGNGHVFLFPTFAESLDRHVHYRFPLVCRPAGTTSPPVPGERHVITASSPEEPGWLPASDSTFEGLAPAGAAFGYNFAQHPSLATAWPPVPIGQVTVEWNKGLDKDVGYTGVPLGTSGLCYADRYGLWWMSDCYGDVPWPIEYDSATSESYSESALECPRHIDMALLLWFTKVQFATDVNVVRSVQSGDDRIIVRCVGGTPGASGDLEIVLDLNLIVTEDAPGYQVLKGLSDSTFTRGPVCEGVYSGSDNVVLSSPEQTHVDPEDTGSPLMYHGPVQITVTPSDSKELSTQIIRASNVEEEFYQNYMYLGFKSGQEASVRCKIHIPFDAVETELKAKLRLRILGRASGTLPQLTVTGRLLPRPDDGLDTPQTLPGAGDEFDLTIDTQGVLTANNQYVEAESEEFAVVPGDIFFYTIERSDSDGYAAEVGILQQVGILVIGE